MKKYISKIAALVFMAVTLSACGQATYNNVTYLPAVSGKARYSVSGVVMLPKFEKGATKPYIEKGFTKACPDGLRYIELHEAINKEIITGVWIQWNAIIECK